MIDDRPLTSYVCTLTSFVGLQRNPTELTFWWHFLLSKWQLRETCDKSIYVWFCCYRLIHYSKLGTNFLLQGFIVTFTKVAIFLEHEIPLHSPEKSHPVFYPEQNLFKALTVNSDIDSSLSFHLRRSLRTGKKSIWCTIDFQYPSSCKYCRGRPEEPIRPVRHWG